MQVMWKVHHGMLSAKGIATTRIYVRPGTRVEAGVLLLSRYINAYGTVREHSIGITEAYRYLT